MSIRSTLLTVGIIKQKTPMRSLKQKTRSVVVWVYRLYSANHPLNQIPDHVEKDMVMEDESMSESREGLSMLSLEGDSGDRGQHEAEFQLLTS